MERIDDPGKDAILYLDDLRYIEQHFGVPDTWTFDIEFVPLETYRVLTPETISQLGIALLTVILVVLFITVNLQVTFLVVFVVLLVDFFVLAGSYYWGLTLNNILSVQLSFALGISVDYSSHIAHTYLHVVPPPHLKTNKQKREYKAKKAISQMGSSVFHGGFSTFLAVSVMYTAKLYTFEVFYKSWTFIIVCGLLNGIVLLPILLSIVGPVSEESKTETEVSSSASSNSSNS